MKYLNLAIAGFSFWPTLAIAQVPAPSDLGDASLSLSQIEDLRNGQSLRSADIAAARPIDAVTIALIISFEGWSSKAYDDPSNYCTIGYGHLIALKPCAQIDLAKLGFAGIISEDTGRSILFQDTLTSRLAVSDLVHDSGKLTADQFGALVSFTFNVGKTNFQNSQLLQFVNAAAYQNVPDELKKWVKSKGQVLPGLIRRRACEGKLFVGSLQLNATGSVDCPMPALAAASDTNAIDITTGK